MRKNDRASSATVPRLFRLALFVLVVVASQVPTYDAASSSQAPVGLIAFSKSIRGGPYAIYVTTPKGGDVRKLADGCCIAWSRDGSRAVYADREALYILNADGSGRRKLVSGMYLSEAEWSPDDRKIVYANARGIALINADGSGQAQLTTNTPGVLLHESNPHWSPNGKRIVFERLFEEGGHNGTDIFIMSADGSNETRLTHGFGHDCPSWAPGGRRIAFRGWTERGDDSNYDTYVMNANGSETRALTHTRESEGAASWSPDGRRILFKGGRGAGSDIYTVLPNGRRHRNLTRSSRYDFEPSWSPDGRDIVLSSARDGNHDIYVMDVRGRTSAILTNGTRGTAYTSPLWSP